ncbi:hypothetical protein [Pseudomonas aeruginosa]|uniref:hypothetical protein n=1 Tax=Pseudomonas aeruginosa TaxID=287 RepID=UPI0009406231|nr:hypothetical protein [Pseudomonas aeruginosa]
MVAAKRYTEEEKAALIEEFHSSGVSMSAFCKQDGKPSYPVFSKWLDKGERAGVGASVASYDSKLFDEFTKTIMPEDVDKRYIRYLEGKVGELEEKVRQLEEQR